MLDVSDAHRFRKTVAGLCMILAPALFLAASIIAPGFESDEGAMASIIAGDRDAFLTSEVLALAGWTLFIPAVLGMMHMLRERGVAEGHLGGLLALLGAVGVIAQSGLWLALSQSASAEQTATLLTAVGDNAATMIALFILPFGVVLGTLVLGWALYRRHLAPTWMAAAIGLAAILFAVGAIGYWQEYLIAGSAVLLVGLGGLGRKVLQESVEDWDHTPELAAGAR